MLTLSLYCKKFAAYSLIILSVLLLIIPTFIFCYFSSDLYFTNQFKYFSFIAIFSLLLPISTALHLEYHRYKNRIPIMLGIGVIYTIVNSFVNSTSIYNESILEYLCCFTFYLMMIGSVIFFRGKKNETYFLWVILASALIESILGILQIYSIVPSLNALFKVTGTFINPAPYALYLAAIFPLAVSICLFSKNKNPITNLALITSIAIILVLPATRIRASWISVVLGTTIVVGYKYKASFFFNIKRILCIKNGFVLLLTVISICFFYGLYRLKPVSTAGRLLIWKVSILKFSERPLFGIGYSNYSKKYNLWQAEYFRNDSMRLEQKYLSRNASSVAENIQIAYNEYLEMFIESGVLGFFLFILPIVSIVFNFLKLNSLSAFEVGIFGCFCSILISGFFSYPFHSLPTFILYFIVLGFLSIKTIKNKECLKQSIRKITFGSRIQVLKAFRISFSILFSLLLLGSYSKVLQYKKWSDAKKFVSVGDNKKATHLYESIYSELKNDPRYLIDYGITLNETGQYNAALIQLDKSKKYYSDPRAYINSGLAHEKLGSYRQAMRDYEIAYLIQPGRIYPMYLLAKLNRKMFDTAKAKNYARRILRSEGTAKRFISGEIIQEMEDLVTSNK